MQDYQLIINISHGEVGANCRGDDWSNLGSVHQVPITAGWIKEVWRTFAWHFYTWLSVGIEIKAFW